MRPLTVLDLLERSAREHPHKTAVIDKDGSYTYSGLLQASRAIGLYLARRLAEDPKGSTRRPVVLLMEKSRLHLAAMYGVLYSGNFYVPLDHKTPGERLDSILSTAKAEVVLTGEDIEAIISDSESSEVEAAPEDSGNVFEDDALLEDIRAHIVDTDLMYLIFTSGSTGVPKGVAISHRAVMDYIDAFISQIGLCQEDVCGNQSPFYTDFSLRDVYGSVSVGAAMVIIPQSYFISPKRLLSFMEENGVTFLSWVPTAYRLVSQFDGLSKVRPSGIQKILFSGETMPVPVYRYWRSFYPTADYIQCYGPTEATGACCFYRPSSDYGDTDTIPIGKPFKNTGVILLDEEGNIIPPGETGRQGEICVYGACLADGYYNNPEKTAEAFVKNPLYSGTDSRMYRTGDLAGYDDEGNLVFASRRDYQVKHGGKRIELGEIETAVLSVPGIRAACCVQRRSDDTLVLFYTGSPGKGEIQGAVSGKLPKYMIPGEYVQKDELPMLESGKLDRRLMDETVNP